MNYCPRGINVKSPKVNFGGLYAGITCTACFSPRCFRAKLSVSFIAVSWDVGLFLLKSYLPSCVWIVPLEGWVVQAEAVNQLQIIASKMSASKEKLPWPANSSQPASSLPPRQQLWNLITQEMLYGNARGGCIPVRMMTGSAEKQKQVFTGGSIFSVFPILSGKQPINNPNGQHQYINTEAAAVRNNETRIV